MQNNDIKIGFISNIVFEPFLIPAIKSQFGENTIISFIPIEEHNEEKYREKLKNSSIIVVWLNLELMFSESWNLLFADTLKEQELIDRILFTCKNMYSDLQSYKNSHFLWFLFEDYYLKFPVVLGSLYDGLIDKINICLTDMLKSNVSFIDLKRLIAKVGVTNAYDYKSKYRWNAQYSKILIESAAKEIHKQYIIEKGVTKKCLVLDCDNVLWGGIISEDGIENIKLSNSGLGRAYQDFQRYILSLYYHGVILAVCSKNDMSDVLTMFREHGEMILKEDHIACFKINWNSKSENIQLISETLHIDLDSMVFIDDSPIEIAAVKSILPDVTAILYDRYTIYDKLSCFNLKSNTNVADIETRNRTYQTNIVRETLKSKYENYNEFIKALEIKIDIHEARPVEYRRISELTQRTNRCTNGRRYTVAEIKERVKTDTIKLYSFFASDRFSDLGLVGAVEIEKNNLTLFSFSCRALGRELEQELLKFVDKEHKIENIEFCVTGKNIDLKKIFVDVFPNAIFYT